MPVVGHALEFLRNRPALLQRGQKEVGPVFTVKLGPQNVVVMIGPEYHRVFFMETDKKLNIATPYKFLKVTFGEVLFIAGHDEYLRQKPFITQAFRPDSVVRSSDSASSLNFLRAFLSSMSGISRPTLEKASCSWRLVTSRRSLSL